MKTAVIGLGAIFETHFAAIKNGGFTTLCAVCDIKNEKLSAALEKIADENVKGYTDYKEMIDTEKPDVVHVCTPHYLHRDMAVYALEAGCDVYLEKPAAMNAKEAMEIVEASERCGKKVCVSFQNRVIPTNALAKEIVDDARYGKLLGIRAEMTWSRGGAYYTESGWRGTWEKEGGGVLMNQSIHTLDLMYCFGGKVERVEGSVALRKNRGTIEVEDTAEATIWFENGVTGIFYATNCHAVSTPAELELVCERGSLLIRNDRLYVNADGVLREATTNDGAAVGKAVWGAGHVAMIGEFYKSILGEGGDYCYISDGYRVLEIIEGIYGSSEKKLR